MKTYRQYITEQFDAYGKEKPSMRQHLINKAKAKFREIVRKYHSPKPDGREYLYLEMFHRGYIFRDEEDRKNETYKQLASKYGGNFPLVYIEMIELDPEERNKGIGTKIMKELVDVARQYKIPILLVASGSRGSDVSKLVEFYKKFGFKPCPDGENFKLPDELRRSGTQKNAPHNTDIYWEDDVPMIFIP